ncbi:hypothetical protein EJD97_003563, partial [Solanum chilense]
VSKNLNLKDRVNNFVAFPGESVSNSWDRFTSFVRSVPNNHIDDESLKENFYRGKYDNNKVVLDIIADFSYGECTYAEIVEKMEKISHNNKAWRIRKSNIGRDTFAAQMARVEDMLQKMRRRFATSDEHSNKMRGDLANIGQKVDAHAISIKHLELHMAQLSATVNPRQPGTLPINTIQNPKNDGHCIVVTNQDGKKTIDPYMPSGVENEVRKEDELVEDNGELVDKEVKKSEIPQKVIPIHRPPLPFPQTLVKKTEDGKYRRFITMLKQLSINFPLIESLEQIPGYAKLMKDIVTNKRSVSFEDDDQMQHSSAITTRSLVQKKQDPDFFTIPCTIGLLYFAKARCDLGARINLKPLSINKKLGLGDPKPTSIWL